MSLRYISKASIGFSVSTGRSGWVRVNHCACCRCLREGKRKQERQFRIANLSMKKRQGVQVRPSGTNPNAATPVLFESAAEEAAVPPCRCPPPGRCCFGSPAWIFPQLAAVGGDRHPVKSTRVAKEGSPARAVRSIGRGACRKGCDAGVAQQRVVEQLE